MYAEHVRPPTGAERAAIVAIIEHNSTSVSVLSIVAAAALRIVIFLVAVVGFIFLLQQLAPVGRAIIGTLFALAALVAFAVFAGDVEQMRIRRRATRDFLANRARFFQSALDQNLVRAREVLARSVVVLEENEDEGQGYLFEVGDDEHLFLQGQHIYPDDLNAPWPSSDFSIVETVEEKQWIGIFCRGPELKPARTLPLGDFPVDLLLRDNDLLMHGTIDTVLAELKNPRAQGSA